MTRKEQVSCIDPNPQKVQCCLDQMFRRRKDTLPSPSAVHRQRRDQGALASPDPGLSCPHMFAQECASQGPRLASEKISRSQNLMTSGSLSRRQTGTHLYGDPVHALRDAGTCPGPIWGIDWWSGGWGRGPRGRVSTNCKLSVGVLRRGPCWLGRLEAHSVLHDVLDQVNHRLYAGDPAILQPTMRLEREGRRRAAPSNLGFLCRVPALLLVTQLLLAPQVLASHTLACQLPLQITLACLENDSTTYQNSEI